MYKCEICNKTFCKTKHKRFCSLKCYWESLKGKSTWNYQGDEFRKCLFCAKLFKVRKVSNQKFCSKDCSSKGKSKKKNYWGKRRIICSECKKSFIAWKYEINRKYCSKKCLGIANGKRMSGNKNWNWKGGISPRVLNTVEYKNWRKEVFKRDNFICQNCGYDKGKILNAHHIKSWNKNPELRFDVNNGITLCVNCHRKTDTFGRKMILSNK